MCIIKKVEGEKMEYTIKEFAQLATVSTRTLRYYDKIGLLKPARKNASGYRIYGEKEIDLLQQILFYKELNFNLKTIKEIIYAPDFNLLAALEEHLDKLNRERSRIDLLINILEKTICEKKGGEKMKEQDKFAAFKNKIISENEKAYGKEIRDNYGDDAINESNDIINNMSEADFDKVKNLEIELFKVLKAAFEEGNPKSELAQRAAILHKQWLSIYLSKSKSIDKNSFKEAHKNIVQMYLDDERFAAYYDKIAPGVTQFLKDAVFNYWA